MSNLHIDEINTLDTKINEINSKIRAMKPSEIIEKRKDIVSWVEDYLMYAYVYGVDKANKELGFDLLAEPKEVSDTLNKSIDGKTYKDRINEYAEVGDAESIARVITTESHRDYGEGKDKTARKGGATKKTWVTMGDEKVRDLHEYLDGVTIGIDEEFYTYDGDHGRFPGDFGSVENNANCRCWNIYS